MSRVTTSCVHGINCCEAVISFYHELSDEFSELLEWVDDQEDPRLHELGLGGVGRRYGMGRLRALRTNNPSKLVAQALSAFQVGMDINLMTFSNVCLHHRTSTV